MTAAGGFIFHATLSAFITGSTIKFHTGPLTHTVMYFHGYSRRNSEVQYG